MTPFTFSLGLYSCWGEETGEYATDPYAESLCLRIRTCRMCIENLNSIYFNEDRKHVNLCCTHLHALALRRWGMYIHTFFSLFHLPDRSVIKA